MRTPIDKFRLMARESLMGTLFDFELNEPASLAESLDSRMGDILEQDGVEALASFVIGIKEYYDNTTSGKERFTWFIRGFRRIALQDKSPSEITEDVKTWLDFGLSYQSNTALKIAFGENLYQAAHLLNCWEDAPCVEMDEIISVAAKVSNRNRSQPINTIIRHQESFKSWYDLDFQNIRQKVKSENMMSFSGYGLLCSRLIAGSERCPAAKVQKDLIVDLFSDLLNSVKENKQLEEKEAYQCVKGVLFELTVFSSPALGECLNVFIKDKAFKSWKSDLLKEKFALSTIPIGFSLAGQPLTGSYLKGYVDSSDRKAKAGWSRWCFSFGKFDEAKLWESAGAHKITTNQLLKLMRKAQSFGKGALHPEDELKVEKDLAVFEKIALTRKHEDLIPKNSRKVISAL